MDDMRLKFYSPVVTGTPDIRQSVRIRPKQAEQNRTEDKNSFQAILKERLQKSSDISFSKHAVKRALENNIELSDESLARLNEGVKLAEAKNLDDTLILVGGTAFLVNIKNNTVITAVDSSEMKGSVFTNIDGTVII